MDIYNYDEITKEYTFADVSDEVTVDVPTGSPIILVNTTVDVIPGGATEIEPPNIGSNEAAIFDETTQTWSLVPDYRGETWYNTDGVAIVINQLNYDPASNGLTLTRSIAAGNQDLLDAKIKELKDAQKVAADAPIVYNSNTFQGNRRSRDNMAKVQAALGAGVTLPTGFVWRDLSNNNISFTTADLNALSALMFVQVNSALNKYWGLKDQAEDVNINALDFQAQMDAITW